MQEMLEYIVKNLVSNPDAVEISVENPAEGALKAGEYVNKIRYVLREGQE